MAEQDQFAGLVASLREQLEAPIQAHVQKIASAQMEFEALVAASTKQIKDLMAGVTPSVEKPPSRPQAVWHEGHLVLNREAAALIDELLSRTGEVLSEVGKLVANRPKPAK